MPAAGTRAFLGKRPRISPHLIEDINASDCSDAVFEAGVLTPLKGLATERTFTQAPLTVYKWEDTNTWLSWTTRVHVAKAINPSLQRLYFSGDGAPKVGIPSDAPGGMFEGAGPYPGTTFNLGMPAPGAGDVLYRPPVAITTLEPDTERDYAELDLETRYYVLTYVDKMWAPEEIESAASPVSLQVNCYDDSHITVTLPGAPVSNGYRPPSHVRIYRTNTGTSTTAFQYVGEAPIASTTFLDNLTNAELTEVAETLEWVPPPTDLTCLTLVAGDFYAGISGNEVCFSESKVAYAWPFAYRFPLDDKPVGIAANGTDLVVLTTGRPVVFVGNSPSTMQQIRLAEFQPCMSEPSIAVFAGMVIYAGTDALIGVNSSQGFVRLTDEILTDLQWAALDPSSMRIAVWGTDLLLCSDVGTWILSLQDKAIQPISPDFACSYYDGYTDTLYVANGTTLYRFGAGASLPYSWTSKVYFTPQSGYAVARVITVYYAPGTTFEYLVDGSVMLRRAIVNDKPFRLPAVRGRAIQYRLTGTAAVVEAAMATTPGELIL